MSIGMRRAFCMGALALVGFGLSRAAQYKFREKEQAVRREASEQLQKLGLTRGAAKVKYFTPEISMVSAACLQAGGVGDVDIRGKFPPGTHFIFENDNIEVVKESLTPSGYHATLKAAPGIGPQSAGVQVIAPVTGLTAQHPRAAVVGGKFEFQLQAANGWKIVARTSGEQTCGDKNSDGNPYEVLFYRNNEANPFEKRSAKLYYSLWESTNYRFAISQEDASAEDGQRKAQDLMRKMQDPNLPPAARQALIQEMLKAQEGTLAKMKDPNYLQNIQAKQLGFGCERIELKVDAGAANGQMSCSEKVGRRIAVTGTMARR